MNYIRDMQPAPEHAVDFDLEHEIELNLGSLQLREILAPTPPASKVRDSPITSTCEKGKEESEDVAPADAFRVESWV